MPFKRFHFQVILRILLLLSSFIVGTYFLTESELWLLSIWFYLAFVLGTISLIRYVEKAHRDLYYFLLSIKERDFSISYPHKKNDELNYAFDTINSVLNDLRNEKASNLIYMQTVVEHIGVALICLDGQQVVLQNKAAKRLFGLEHLKSVDKLYQLNEELGSVCNDIKTGDQELLKITLHQTLYNLSLEATEFSLRGTGYKLISFKDIKAELEANELESWQKLIRVLTHEIKNSAIPISTLSDVILQMIQENRSSFEQIEDGETLEDILGGLETIQSRSKGLVDFVTTYDRLAKIPQPKFQEVNIAHLLEGAHKLMDTDIKKKDIGFKMRIEEPLTVNLDPSLIDQVLINLIKNAIEVVQDQSIARIEIEAKKVDNQVQIIVSDNGPGIPAEVLENIFVPFYTTKSYGSGIGLSLSRQIMKAHNGNISVSTTSNGSAFTLSF